MSDHKYKNSTCACDYGDVMGLLDGDEHFADCPLAGEPVEAGAFSPRAPLDRKELERKYIATHGRITRLEQENEEWEQSFALYDAAVQRGTELWRSENPGARALTSPDTAKLVAWLLGERDRVERQLAEARKIATAAINDDTPIGMKGAIILLTRLLAANPEGTDECKHAKWSDDNSPHCLKCGLVDAAGRTHR